MYKPETNRQSWNGQPLFSIVFLSSNPKKSQKGKGLFLKYLYIIIKLSRLFLKTGLRPNVAQMMFPVLLALGGKPEKADGWERRWRGAKDRFFLKKSK